MTTASAGHRRGVRGVIPVLSDAQRLTVAREYVGLTQGELAERLGVGTATVQRAESGKTTPRRTTFMAWSMATGVDLDWLEKGDAANDDPDGGGSEWCARRDSNPQPSGQGLTLVRGAAFRNSEPRELPVRAA